MTDDTSIECFQGRIHPIQVGRQPIEIVHRRQRWFGVGLADDSRDPTVTAGPPIVVGLAVIGELHQ